ncbi:MAG: hypothetical protein OXI46_11275 [Gemmatimonadota bacterium]|nr:hypothetical protein [Gemmatimonadota bacterium]
MAWTLSGAAAQTADPNSEGLVFLCPISVLQDAYAALSDPTDVLSTLAIERHVLAICRDSQLKLLDIHQNNQRLSELFALSIGRMESAGEPVEVPEVVVRAVVAEEEPAPVFGLVAVMRRGGGRPPRAVLRVDDATVPVRVGAELATGHRVEAIEAAAVRLIAPDGSDVRVE